LVRVASGNVALGGDRYVFLLEPMLLLINRRDRNCSRKMFLSKDSLSKILDEDCVGHSKSAVTNLIKAR
jgi:hypothetical protein